MDGIKNIYIIEKRIIYYMSKEFKIIDKNTQ